MGIFRRKTQATRLLFLVTILLCVNPDRSEGAAVTIPIPVDYPLLRHLLIKQLFNTTDQRRELLNDSSGCSQIVLANPQLYAKRTELEIQAQVDVQIGVDLLDNCTALLQWQGGAVFLIRPEIHPRATSLDLRLIDSWLISKDGRRITDARVWGFVQNHFHTLFDTFTLDLKPLLDNLSQVLSVVLPYRTDSQVQDLIETLRIIDVWIKPDHLEVSLGMEVDDLDKRSRPETLLGPQELLQWESRWQMMDAMFTFAVKQLAFRTGLPELRDTLLEILIDARYRLGDALALPADRMNDPVRHRFLDSWKRISPVVRRIGLQQPDQQPLLWLSLLTATDALYALDRLGPHVGLEISTDGLRRLVRLIESNPEVDPLHYEQKIDPDLRQLFDSPAIPESERPFGIRFNLMPIRTAWAEPRTERLDRWAPRTDQLGEYLPLVAHLLEESTEKTLHSRTLKPDVMKLFRQLVLATAWQESCWRQYVIKKKRIEPLRSSTGDVGLMQINERVWRGFYDIENLRWNIAYNSQAGTEVLLNYLLKYALKKGEHNRRGGLDNLARASYSAYNGGPSQVARYRKQDTPSTQKKIDAAFYSKYLQVKAGKELNVAQCLGGDAPDPTGQRASRKSAQERVSGRKPGAVTPSLTINEGEVWVRGQNAKRFTLQLGAFSKRESATKFSNGLSLPGPIGIYPQEKEGTRYFLVLYGSYESRTGATQAKKSLKRLKPWLRQFGELANPGNH